VGQAPSPAADALVGSWAGPGDPPHATYNEVVQLTIELPEDVLEALTNRCADVQALAAEGYRSGVLSESQIKRMLGYESRVQVHTLLKNHSIPYRYAVTDVSDDLDAHRELGTSG